MSLSTFNGSSQTQKGTGPPAAEEPVTSTSAEALEASDKPPVNPDDQPLTTEPLNKATELSDGNYLAWENAGPFCIPWRTPLYHALMAVLPGLSATDKALCEDAVFSGNPKESKGAIAAISETSISVTWAKWIVLIEAILAGLACNAAQAAATRDECLANLRVKKEPRRKKLGTFREILSFAHLPAVVSLFFHTCVFAAVFYAETLVGMIYITLGFPDAVAISYDELPWLTPAVTAWAMSCVVCVLPPFILKAIPRGLDAIGMAGFNATLRRLRWVAVAVAIPAVAYIVGVEKDWPMTTMEVDGEILKKPWTPGMPAFIGVSMMLLTFGATALLSKMADLVDSFYRFEWHDYPPNKENDETLALANEALTQSASIEAEMKALRSVIKDAAQNLEARTLLLYEAQQQSMNAKRAQAFVREDS